MSKLDYLFSRLESVGSIRHKVYVVFAIMFWANVVFDIFIATLGLSGFGSQDWWRLVLACIILLSVILAVLWTANIWLGRKMKAIQKDIIREQCRLNKIKG